MMNGLTSTVIKAVEKKQNEYYDAHEWRAMAKYIGVCTLEGIIDGMLISGAIITVVSAGKLLFKKK